jgi:hypothetical protein
LEINISNISFLKMSVQGQRPVRERRAPDYLGDYEWGGHQDDADRKERQDAAGSDQDGPGGARGGAKAQQPTDVRPKMKEVKSRSPDDGKERLLAVERIITKREFFMMTIERDGAKIRTLITEAGSRTLMRRVTDRVRQAWTELAAMTRMLIEYSEIRTEMTAILTYYDEVKQYVDELEDDLEEHLEERQEEAPSHLGSRNQLHVIPSTKFDGRPPSKAEEEDEDHEVLKLEDNDGTEKFTTPKQDFPTDGDDRESMVFKPSEPDDEEPDDEQDVERDDDEDVDDQEAVVKEQVALLRVKQEKIRHEEKVKILSAQKRLFLQEAKDKEDRDALETSLREKEGLEPQRREDSILLVKRSSSTSSRSQHGAGSETGLPKTPLERYMKQVEEESAKSEITSAKPVPIPSKNDKSTNAALHRFFQGIAKPQIPKFTGESDKYQDWRAQFDIFVHQAEVPHHFKMVMLKQAVTGKASQLIERLGYSEPQYEMALTKLEQRYGGEKRQLQRQIESIISLPTVREENLTELEDTANRLCDVVAKLVDHGLAKELSGTSSLYTLVLQKMPEGLMLKYYDNLKEDSFQKDGLAKFTDWLNGHVCRRIELAEIQKNARKTLRPEKSKNDKTRSSVHASQAAKTQKRKGISQVHSTSDEVGSSPTADKSAYDVIQCPICEKGPHLVNKCRQWWSYSISERWNIAKDKGLCYRCLGTNHRGRNCRQSKKWTERIHHQLNKQGNHLTFPLEYPLMARCFQHEWLYDVYPFTSSEMMAVRSW